MTRTIAYCRVSARDQNPVAAGFSTQPHWDHLLWHPRFGDVPRYATSASAHPLPGSAEAARFSPWRAGNAVSWAREPSVWLNSRRSCR